MKLILEINISKERRYYRTYTDDCRLDAITGSGWAVIDAVDDFLHEFNKDAFFDDDTASMLKREDIEITRVLNICNCCKKEKRMRI